MGQPSKIAVPISNWSPESSVKFLYKMLLTQNRSGSNFGYVDGGTECIVYENGEM